MTTAARILLFTACALLLTQSFAQELTAEELEAEEQLVLRIREHVLAGNFFELEKILGDTSNITTVSRGFRFEPEDAAIFARVTPDRVNDPDVNAIRSFADSLINGQAQPDTLAEVFTAVLYAQGPEYAPDPAATFMGLFESFSNLTEMQLILDADPKEIFDVDAEPPSAEGVDSGRRRLLVKKGVAADTPLCNSCFEKGFCKKNAPWC